jgi:hypothetical protein
MGLKRTVRDQQNLFDANVVLIGDKASGTQLIQELIADKLPRRHALPARLRKIMRRTRRPR